MSEEATVYHERQKQQLCALHVLNNLFQQKGVFTKADLDKICTDLSPSSFMNPHRSMLGLGNYDVNVIMAALQTKNLCTIWFDKRKNVSCINLDNIIGLILNVPSDFSIGFLKLPFNFKHWFMIRQVGGVYYNLDSKLSAPEALGGSTEVMTFLTDLMKLDNRELLLAVEPSVEQSGSWMKQSEGQSQSCPSTATNEMCSAIPAASGSEMHQQNTNENEPVKNHDKTKQNGGSSGTEHELSAQSNQT